MNRILFWRFQLLLRQHSCDFGFIVLAKYFHESIFIYPHLLIDCFRKQRTCQCQREQLCRTHTANGTKPHHHHSYHSNHLIMFSANGTKPHHHHIITAHCCAISLCCLSGELTTLQSTITILILIVIIALTYCYSGQNTS